MSDESDAVVPHNILIAGDGDVVRVLDDTGLPGDGAEVFVAGNGAGAICKLVSSSYDVAIIDHSLQRVDGLRLVALIRSTVAVSEIPIVVVVEEGDERARLEALRGGANLAMAKPVDGAALREALDKLLAPARRG